MKNILLIGGGGHCASVADVLLERNEYDKIGIVDPTACSGLFGIIPVIGKDEDLPQLFKAGYEYAFVSLGSIMDTRTRERLFGTLTDIGFSIPCIIAPSASVSRNARLGCGIFVGQQAVINAGAAVGDCAIINTSAVVEHDCRVGPFAHLATAAALGGNVTVGAGAHIGAGSVVRQGLSIGQRAVIGAGSVVTRDIPANVEAFGNPCRVIKSYE